MFVFKYSPIMRKFPNEYTKTTGDIYCNQTKEKYVEL